MKQAKVTGVTGTSAKRCSVFFGIIPGPAPATTETWHSPTGNQDDHWRSYCRRFASTPWHSRRQSRSRCVWYNNILCWFMQQFWLSRNNDWLQAKLLLLHMLWRQKYLRRWISGWARWERKWLWRPAKRESTRGELPVTLPASLLPRMHVQLSKVNHLRRTS